MTIGIDVYQENGSPRWTDAKRVGIDFAIVRAMEMTTKDTRYDEYIADCRVAGIATSPYQLLHWGAASASPEEQMHAYLDFIGPCDHRRPPPCIDVEWPHGRAATGLTAGQAYDWLLRAVVVVKAAIGVMPMIYASKVDWEDPDGMNNLPGAELAECPFWPKWWPYAVGDQAVYSPMIVNNLPNPPTPAPWRDQWMMTQYAGDAINCPGFATKVDMNRTRTLHVNDHNGTVAWIQRHAGGLVADGSYGYKTEARIKEIQTAEGLEVDGMVGYFTHSVLAWMAPGLAA
jgi:GH25 family lysozyme M1 (1,4-beta-N-acetylmuramidase)